MNTNNSITVVSLFDGQYEVCEDGKIFSNKRSEKIELKGKVTREGYRMVVLTSYKRKIYKNVHRLIAECFVPNPNNLPQVNHKDGDKLNNAADNLEWVNGRQNLKHARDNGLLKMCKINMSIANLIRKIRIDEKLTHRELARLFGVKKTQIGYILNDKRWLD